MLGLTSFGSLSKGKKKSGHFCSICVFENAGDLFNIAGSYLLEEVQCLLDPTINENSQCLHAYEDPDVTYMSSTSIVDESVVFALNDNVFVILYFPCSGS